MDGLTEREISPQVEALARWITQYANEADPDQTHDHVGKDWGYPLWHCYIDEAEKVLADPEPLLEALVSAGLLQKQHRTLEDGSAGVGMDAATGEVSFYSRSATQQPRYATPWRNKP